MKRLLSTLVITICCFGAAAQVWHNKERTIRYLPSGRDFVCVNGKHRFNRALYGSNTAFRAEAGDLPEFAMYMPGMGGNMKLGIIANGKSKWLTTADAVTAIYRPGTMIYEIKDNLLGNGKLYITALALADAEGLMIKTRFEGVKTDVQLLCAYGGATGKKFSRDGDIGADPESSFYLKPEYCKDNVYTIQQNSFSLQYGSGKVATEEGQYELAHNQQGNQPTAAKNTSRYITGIFPAAVNLKQGDAAKQESPLQLTASTGSATPLVYGLMPVVSSAESYFLLQPKSVKQISYKDLPTLFAKAEAARKQLAERIIVSTPDSFINTLGGALAVAADATWEDPSFMHGAIAWRMRLNAWRGAYCADALGWHDRAKKHFDSYALSQLTSPDSGPVTPDTIKNLARETEKMGTALFTSGYICRNPNGDFRPHHYDMNLVFIDILLNHFQYTGDTAYVRKMFPLIKRHLAWEKRNFDADDDGLYDAYAVIWASDAMQYSGGGVAHSSAYNYKANYLAADLANIIGEDGSSYRKEAAKIWNAMQTRLWVPDKGVMAEYSEWGNNHRLHTSPGLWTIYHTIDSKAATPSQSWQMLNYVNTEIPHIPVKATGLADSSLYMLSTTNWQPYDWSLNNVALAEQLHTALAYWQTGDNEEAYKMWKSALVESMYLGSSPANFQQLSFYDAERGELYRDFGDGIGMVARSLTEGLFGIQPDALHDTLSVHPGFPKNWDSAHLQTPDIDLKFNRQNLKETYIIHSEFYKKSNLIFKINAFRSGVVSVKINGKATPWHWVKSADYQYIELSATASNNYKIDIVWTGDLVKTQKEIITDSFKGISQTENLNISKTAEQYAINLKPYFNESVTNIFKQKYLAPRPSSPTLQLPAQGIGNWCYPFIQPEINDSGLRVKAGKSDLLVLQGNVRFETPTANTRNIIFTSLWNNFPDSVVVPVSGKASEIYLLMTGTTNPMQSRMDNGIVTVTYTDGSISFLKLNNPENWSPVEQDYYTDGYAFTAGKTKPVRISLKSGEPIGENYHYTSIKGFSNRAIDGGAATILHIDLEKEKQLKSLTIKTLSSDVIIGLMSATLVR